MPYFTAVQCCGYMLLGSPDYPSSYAGSLLDSVSIVPWEAVAVPRLSFTRVREQKPSGGRRRSSHCVVNPEKACSRALPRPFSVRTTHSVRALYSSCVHVPYINAHFEMSRSLFGNKFFFDGALPLIV